MTAKFVLSEYTLAHIYVQISSEGSRSFAIWFLPDVGWSFEAMLPAEESARTTARLS